MQTPRTAAGAGDLAARAGFSMVERIDYRIDRAPRTLLTFRRAEVP
jgi:hypothetical protein